MPASQPTQLNAASRPDLETMSTTCPCQDPTSTPSPSPMEKSNMRRWSSALESLSEWFWSAWTINNSETHGSLMETFDVVDNSYLFSSAIDDECPRLVRESASTLQYQCGVDGNAECTECKGCRARGVTCDGRRPRCSHCLDQQVLCFYVAPPRKLKGTARSKSVHQALKRTQTQTLVGDGYC